MNAEYQKEITDLTDWFQTRLPAFGDLVIKNGDYEYGVDKLTGKHMELCNQAFNEWMVNRNWELSYNQMCIAFFCAAKKLGLLIIV